MPGWVPRSEKFNDLIAEEYLRLERIREAKKASIGQWQPPDIAHVPSMTPQMDVPVDIPEPMMSQEPATLPEPWQPPMPEPEFDYSPEPMSFTPQQMAAPQPVAQPEITPQQEVPKEDFTKELDATHPFKLNWNENVPLWAKVLDFVGKPFELVQEYAFDPLLGAIQGPWAEKTLTPQELKTAKNEGIMSYFPGGVRHKAYEQLDYTGKWLVEMVPWLVVPGGGIVKGIGTGAKVGGTIGKAAGKAATKAATIGVAKSSPTLEKAINAIGQVEAKLPEQAVMNKALRSQQIQNAMPALETGRGENALSNFMVALRGQGEKVEWKGIRSKLSKNEIDELSDVIRTTERVAGLDKAPLIKGWRSILDGPNLPVDNELDKLEKVFGPDLVQSLLNKRPGATFNKIVDVLNAPRATVASFDLSGLLRQGFILASRHPLEAMKTVKPMMKAVYSDKNTKLVDDVIRSRPHTAMLEDAGMYLAPIPGKTVALSKMEESFMSRFVEKVPILGQVVKGSNRAYVTVLNDLRSRNGEAVLSAWEKMGLKYTEADVQGISRVINASSGRGSLPKALSGASPLLNAMFFAPRLFVSRIEWPMLALKGTPLARKEAAKQMASFLGAGASILGMAKIAGAELEGDLRSADFGKMKVGDTRLDVWSGYSQWARFAAQMATATRKTQYGNYSELNRWDVAQRFLQSKFSPGMGLINDILRGETYSGEQVNIGDTDLKRMAYTRLAPLFIQDMIDAIDQEGLMGGVVASPSLFGIGVTTYMSPANKMREKLAQTTYGKSWKEVGLDPTLGLLAQQKLERSSFDLLAEIEKEKEDYNKTITGKSDIGNIYRNQTSNIENQYKAEIGLAVQEYRDTGDGNKFREKISALADNRRSQYDVLNKDPQFSKITAKYNELPDPAEMKKMSPQDWARKWYMSMVYGPDMYDQYGNYRFDMIDDMRDLFAQKFGAGMLEYVEAYQGIKESEMPAEYRALKEAQKTLRPYWQIADKIAGLFGKQFAESKAGQSMISRQRKVLRLSDPKIAKAYEAFYAS